MLHYPRGAGADKAKSMMNKGRQRYKCKTCQYVLTVSHQSETATPDQRGLAMTLDFKRLGISVHWSSLRV